MGIKNKVQILLFPVTLAAGIITGIAIERTKKKAADIAAAGMFPEQGAAADIIEKQYAADKEKEIKADGKLPEFMVNKILQAGSADNVAGLYKKAMEERGLTYEAVLAGER